MEGQANNSSRSYRVNTPTGTFRINRVQLNRLPAENETKTTTIKEPADKEVRTDPTPVLDVQKPLVMQDQLPGKVHQPKIVQTISGRIVKKPDTFY